MQFCRRRDLIKLSIIIVAVFVLLIVVMQRSISNEIISNDSQFKYSKCKVIHIGVVCIGYGYNPHFYTMLKSLYYIRNNPLHFHIIVDDASERVLRTMFGTWTVPQVSVSFYDVKNFASDFWWIPEYQYYPEILSKLLKFIFPKAISTDRIASKIMVVEPNTIFISDIRNLWHMFDNFNTKEVMGFVKYQRNQFQERGPQQSNPEHEEEQKSYNTDIILYNLKCLKTNGLTEKFFKIVNNAILSFGKTKAPDQVVMNAILDNNYSLVYHITGYSSSQIKNNNGYYNTTNIKILDSTEVTVNATNNDGNYEKIYQKLLTLNGSLLRHRLYDCTKHSTKIIAVMPTNENCSDFHEVETHEWRTLLFFREFKYNSTEDDLTFVSQLSYSRRHILETLTTLWKGPISLAVYVTDSELHDFINYIENSSTLKNRSDIGYHAVFKDGENHPINVLRNVALRHVVTPYVFLVDIDFLPMPDLYLVLRKDISNITNMEYKALIVPAFETKGDLPKTKNELSKMMDNGTLIPFHRRAYRPAHAPTNSAKWKLANETYKVTWRPHYEPYVVVERNVTEYDKRFFGYGWNKVSHIMELQAQGYQFLVLPNVFIVHKYHKSSKDKHKFLSSRKRQKCLKKLKYKFITELNTKYDKKRFKFIF